LETKACHFKPASSFTSCLKDPTNCITLYTLLTLLVHISSLDLLSFFSDMRAQAGSFHHKSSPLYSCLSHRRLSCTLYKSSLDFSLATLRLPAWLVQEPIFRTFVEELG
ncbi:hypothetical protein RvY_13104, partial [Ramazzottius varieornatus]